MWESYEMYFRSLIYLFEGFVLLWIAKSLYVKIYHRVDLNLELFGNNNHALAVSTSGYLLAICIALGGAISGPDSGIISDSFSIIRYGLITIAIMLLAGFICEKILLPGFNNTKEIVTDQNMGTAFVEAGLHIANGLVILSILQGQGTWQSDIVFWIMAQIVFIISSRLYEALTSYSIHKELERDNAAVGLALAGVFIALGNIISIAVSGDFTGWQTDIKSFAINVFFGFIVLIIVKKLTILILASGTCLADEQTEEKPNVGAGLIEALGYVGGSMLVLWAL